MFRKSARLFFDNPGLKARPTNFLLINDRLQGRIFLLHSLFKFAFEIQSDKSNQICKASIFKKNLKSEIIMKKRCSGQTVEIVVHFLK